jgi:hypothetical protein
MNKGDGSIGFTTECDFIVALSRSLFPIHLGSSNIGGGNKGIDRGRANLDDSLQLLPKHLLNNGENNFQSVGCLEIVMQPTLDLPAVVATPGVSVACGFATGLAN